MSDQRPLMRRSREDSSRHRSNSSRSTFPPRWHRKLLGFDVLVQRGKNNRPTDLHQARTPVFGARRSNFDADRSITSENRAARLGRSRILTSIELRFADECAGRRLCLRKCERCQIAHSCAAAVRFETSSAMGDLVNFAVHYQKLKQPGQRWHGSCYCDAATLSKG